MRPFVVLALLLVLAPLRARAEDPPASSSARWVDGTLAHQERERTYRLCLPAGHDRARAVPLVLALHGGGGSAETFDRSTNGQFAREAGKRGWLVAFPQGVAKGWNDGRLLSSPRDRERRGVDDVAFLAALIEHLHAAYGIDRTRVHATGISNGGFMSFRLGLELSDELAAIAPVTACLPTVHDGKRPAHAVGLLVIDGTADPLVPYAGGQVRVLGRPRGAIHSAEESARRWVAFNGCAEEPVTTALPDADPRDGTRAFVSTWPAGVGGAEVRLLRVENGGHTWPGGRAYLPPVLVGRVCRDFEAVPVIFDFFARHRRAPTPSRAR